jgi:dihydroorotate dehydrogenase
MSKFKSIKHSYIEKDDFITDAKNLLELKKASIKGSYIRYGKDKSCDLDLNEELNLDIEEIKTYLNKLKLHEDTFILTKLSFDFYDSSIKNLLKKLGYLTGLLHIKNSNINKTDIDPEFPEKFKKKIKKLIKIYNKKNDICSYTNLYMYLKNNLYPTFTLEEAVKGEKIFNGKLIKIYNNPLKYMYIEVIYKNYRVSNFINFIKKVPNNNLIFDVDLNEVLYKNQKKYNMSYYKYLKYFFHFLRQSYFKNLFNDYKLKQKVIDTYNNIFDYREKLGEMNNKLCKIENVLLINIHKNQKKENKKIIKEYLTLKEEFELKCKDYFLVVSKPFLEYLKLNIRFC